MNTWLLDLAADLPNTQSREAETSGERWTMSEAPKVGSNRGNAGKGRPKGSQNKTTAAVKEALALAFDGIGGVKRLTTWAQQNETEFYKLWVKMLPQDVNANVAATIRTVERRIVDPRDNASHPNS